MGMVHEENQQSSNKNKTKLEHTLDTLVTRKSNVISILSSNPVDINYNDSIIQQNCQAAMYEDTITESPA